MLEELKHETTDSIGFKARLGSSGIHLFHRESGANVLLDEVKVPMASWSLAPRFVSVALTNACELSCPYCYAPKRPAALEYDRLLGWLTELDANGCLGVGFGGGEPTLYQKFPELCNFTAQETGLAVTFTTHGHNLSKPLLAEIEGNVHFIRVSMDGVWDTYQALRGRPFEALLEKLRMARALAPLGINFVVNRRTFPELDAAVEIASDAGAVEFLLLPEQPIKSRGGIEQDTYQELKDWICRYRGKVPLTISESGAGPVNISNPLSLESGLREYAHIDAWGVLKETSYDASGQTIGAGGLIKALDCLRERVGDLQQ